MTKTRCCRGAEGSSVRVISSGFDGWETNCQPWQVLQTALFTSLSVPGHHTLVRKRCFIATIFGWPPCTNLSNWQRSCCGTTIRVPRRTSFPIALNSPRVGRYSSVACHFSFKRHSRTLISISRFLKATGVDSLASSFAYSFVWSLSSGSGTGRRWRGKEPAMF